jgi:hypothetical protein
MKADSAIPRSTKTVVLRDDGSASRVEWKALASHDAKYKVAF